MRATQKQRRTTHDHSRRRVVQAGVAAALGAPLLALGQKKYGPGASDTEIKIGSTSPLSGPASAYSILGKTQVAYFKMVSEQGGVRGRKVSLITYDDAYNPSKTLEQTRRLVEDEGVLAMFAAIGTPTNSAVHKYLNGKGVPHFPSTGATKFGDPKNYPWTIGWQPTYRTEAILYARYILQARPNGKVGVLYQNDDFGKDILNPFRETLAAGKGSIVMEASYETSDPTIDSQMLKLKASGADVFLNASTTRVGAQAIRKAAEIGWKPLHVINYSSNSPGSVLKPAGFENSQGLVTALFLKDPTDPRWKGDPALQKFAAFMAKYYPDGDAMNMLNVHAYAHAQFMHRILEMCGDDLTRENVMKQAASFKDVDVDVFLPGIRLNTSPTDFYPVENMQMAMFKGERWETFGPVLSGQG